MKSVIVSPNGHNFEAVERDIPKAEGNRITIRTKYCAICGSDRSLWDAAKGMSLGHEFSGYIEDAGSYPFKKGARVCAAEFNPCGKCEFCLSGREQLCPQMMVQNPGVTCDGAYSEYVSVRGDFVYELPDDVPIELGAIVEPVAVALHGVKYCNIQPGEDVLIWGNGPIGIYAAACAKAVGAGKVYMVGRNKGRVDYCNSFDFVDKCLSTKDPDFAKQLEAIKPELGFAQVIDCLGNTDFDPIVSVMKSGGIIVMLGMHAERFTINAMAMYFKEIQMRTGLYFSKQDYEDAFHMVCKHKDMFLKTISNKIPQDPEVIQDMFIKLFESGSNNECKVLIEYEG